VHRKGYYPTTLMYSTAGFVILRRSLLKRSPQSLVSRPAIMSTKASRPRDRVRPVAPDLLRWQCWELDAVGVSMCCWTSPTFGQHSMVSHWSLPVKEASMHKPFRVRHPSG